MSFQAGILVGVLVMVAVLISLAILIQPTAGTFDCYAFADGSAICRRG